MNIFVMSDPHGNARILREALKEVNEGNYDIFLGLGDFISKEFFSELVTNLKVKEKSFIQGNRDFGIKGLPYLKKMDTFDFDGTRFVMIGSYRFSNIKEKILEKCGDSDNGNLIMASHEPPRGARDKIHSGARIGVPEFREVIEEKQPLIWFCGHIHEAEGVTTLGGTKVVNVSASREVLGYRASVKGGEIEELERLER